MRGVFETKNADPALSFKDVDKKKRVIVGHPSTFGNVDRHKERVMPGAFKRTLHNNGNRIKALMHHDPPQIPGRPQLMKEDEIGLFAETLISKTALGNDLLTLVEDEAIDSMSIGFRTIKDETDEDTGVRSLKEIQLFEYSFVSIPANPEARITGLKSFEAVSVLQQQIEKFEKALSKSVFDSDEMPQLLEIALRQWKSYLAEIDALHKLQVETLMGQKEGLEGLLEDHRLIAAEVVKGLDLESLVRRADVVLPTSDSSKDADSVTDYPVQPSSDSDGGSTPEGVSESEFANLLLAKASEIELAKELDDITQRLKG